MVAHDVNPILSYLDRVVYLGRWRRSRRPPAEVITDRDAHRGSIRRRSRCCVRPTVGSSSSGSPKPPAPPLESTRALMLGSVQPDLTWNLVATCGRSSSSPSWSMRSAPAPSSRSSAAVVGWFMVLRRQTLRRPHARGRRLPRCGWRGAARRERDLGFFVVLHRRRAGHRALPRPHADAAISEESAVIGTVQAFALACGFLFVSLYGGFLNGVNVAAVRQLPRHHRRAGRSTLAVVAVVALGVLAVIGPAVAVRVDRSRRRRAHAACRRARCRSCSSSCSASRPPRRARSPGALLVFALLVVPRRDRPGAHRATGVEHRARRRRSASLVVWASLLVRLLLAVPDRLL